MLNSSEQHGDLVLEARRAPFIRLLLAMAEEWSAIAGDVGKLGAAVSKAAAATDAVGSIRDLQAFDLIQQRAEGQAGLLAKLTRKMADDQMFDRKRLAELVADIPFESVRASLKAAYEGRIAAAPSDAEDVVEWF